MANGFYNKFDTQTWEGPRIEDYRTPFQQDRDRVIHNSAFRRLQAKTQVFLTGEYDFYRTRLTHSLEVAQIGRSICESLKQANKRTKMLSEDFYVDPHLVEAVGLAHDLGHPPFGHAGEGQLNILMKKYGGFEGNAQTLRLLTKTIYSDGRTRTGMSPTRALMDGVMKYKTLHRQTPEAKNHFLYDDQSACLGFVFNETAIPTHLKPGDCLNDFRSIECQIMDWADDTAYCLNDVVDGVRAGFINKQKVERWAASSDLTRNETEIVKKLLNIITDGVLSRDFSIKIGRFIGACVLKERENFMSPVTNRYRYELVIADDGIKSEHKLYKRLVKDIVFNSPQLQQLEFKGNNMIRSMFEAFARNYVTAATDVTLLPKEVETLIRREVQESERARLLCDHLSGMTDDFATRTYRRLFDPTYGSIVDLI